MLQIFPNEDACLLFVCALCVEQNEEWSTGRRYMRMQPLYEGENRILKVDSEKSVLEAPEFFEKEPLLLIYWVPEIKKAI